MPRVNFFATRQESNVGFDNRFLGDTDNTFIGIDVTVLFTQGREPGPRKRSESTEKYRRERVETGRIRRQRQCALCVFAGSVRHAVD